MRSRRYSTTPRYGAGLPTARSPPHAATRGSGSPTSRSGLPPRGLAHDRRRTRRPTARSPSLAHHIAERAPAAVSHPGSSERQQGDRRSARRRRPPHEHAVLAVDEEVGRGADLVREDERKPARRRLVDDDAPGLVVGREARRRRRRRRPRRSPPTAAGRRRVSGARQAVREPSECVALGPLTGNDNDEASGRPQPIARIRTSRRFSGASRATETTTTSSSATPSAGREARPDALRADDVLLERLDVDRVRENARRSRVSAASHDRLRGQRPDDERPLGTANEPVGDGPLHRARQPVEDRCRGSRRAGRRERRAGTQGRRPCGERAPTGDDDDVRLDRRSSREPGVTGRRGVRPAETGERDPVEEHGGCRCSSSRCASRPCEPRRRRSARLRRARPSCRTAASDTVSARARRR